MMHSLCHKKSLPFSRHGSIGIGDWRYVILYIRIEKNKTEGCDGDKPCRDLVYPMELSFPPRSLLVHQKRPAEKHDPYHRENDKEKRNRQAKSIHKKFMQNSHPIMLPQRNASTTNNC